MLLLNHGSLWIVDRCFFFRIQKTEAGVLWDVHCLSEKELKMCREKHVMLFLLELFCSSMKDIVAVHVSRENPNLIIYMLSMSTHLARGSKSFLRLGRWGCVKLRQKEGANICDK